MAGGAVEVLQNAAEAQLSMYFYCTAHCRSGTIREDWLVKLESLVVRDRFHRRSAVIGKYVDLISARHLLLLLVMLVPISMCITR